MAKRGTLNELEHLERVGFGRPWPRHGLQLLYWFCHDYAGFNRNNDLVVASSEHPGGNGYGFHRFDNRLEEDGERLLPHLNQPYYEVGNLNGRGAELPSYVKVNSGRHEDPLNNTDRIIISLDGGRGPGGTVGVVYVTQHKDRSSFDRRFTFRISKGLIKVIGNLALMDLLGRVGYQGPTTAGMFLMIEVPQDDVSESESESARVPEVRHWAPPDRSDRSCCVIL